MLQQQKMQNLKLAASTSAPSIPQLASYRSSTEKPVSPDLPSLRPSLSNLKERRTRKNAPPPLPIGTKHLFLESSLSPHSKIVLPSKLPVLPEAPTPVNPPVPPKDSIKTHLALSKTNETKARDAEDIVSKRLHKHDEKFDEQNTARRLSHAEDLIAELEKVHHITERVEKVEATQVEVGVAVGFQDSIQEDTMSKYEKLEEDEQSDDHVEDTDSIRSSPSKQAQGNASDAYSILHYYEAYIPPKRLSGWWADSPDGEDVVWVADRFSLASDFSLSKQEKRKSTLSQTEFRHVQSGLRKKRSRAGRRSVLVHTKVKARRLTQSTVHNRYKYYQGNFF